MPVLSNLISHLLLVMLGAVIALALYFVKVFPRYRRLLRFFGLSPASPQLRVYFSTLWIPSGTAQDAKGTSRSYQGPAVPEYELEVISTILRPFIELQPRDLPQAVSRRLVNWGLLTVPQIRFAPSPLDDKHLQFENLILVGSRGYNVATEYYVTRGNPYFILDIESRLPTVSITRGRNKGENITAQADIAVLTKIIDQEHNTAVFIAAGLGVNGTLGAIEYLINHWSELQERYGDEEFGVCLKVPPIGEDPTGYRKQDVLRQLP